MAETDHKKPLGGKSGLLAIAVLVGALLVQKFTGIDLLGSSTPEASGATTETRAEGASKTGAAAGIEGASATQTTEAPQHANNGVDFVYQQFQAQRSSVWVTTEGQVLKLLADDTQEPRHQQFLLELDKARKFTVKVAHNIDDAPYIPLKAGDTIQIQGRYEFNELGGIIHFTHRADRPTARKPGGWIEHEGQRYQ